MTKITENFTLEEFRCKDGSKTPVEVWGNITELAENLQVLRNILNEPVIIKSGWRSQKHNENVKGSPTSRHLKGKAADIYTTGTTPDLLGQIIRNLIRTGKMKQGGVGVYKTFVHYDTRGTQARWEE